VANDQVRFEQIEAIALVKLWQLLAKTEAIALVIEHGWPGSFAIAGQPAHGQFPLSTATYFSFVTLATLGLVTSGRSVSPSVVVFEAVAGQFYLAMMIARLVSLYVVGERKKRGS
jgi:hypothetical protein